MNTKMILREYGSWSVFVISYLLGGLLHGGGEFSYVTFLPFLGLVVLINSKLHLSIWLKQRIEKNLIIFLVHILIGFLLLYVSFGKEILALSHLSLIPLLYIIFIYKLGEHHILTEITGFATLTLSVIVASYTINHYIEYRLYLLTFTYFVAGVFKVRVQLRKTMKDRLLMIFYVIFLAILYPLLKIPILPLLPLLENIIYSVTLYRAKLRFTGWMEVTKSLAFMVLTIGYY